MLIGKKKKEIIIYTCKLINRFKYDVSTFYWEYISFIVLDWNYNIYIIGKTNIIFYKSETILSLEI